MSACRNEAIRANGSSAFQTATTKFMSTHPFHLRHRNAMMNREQLVNHCALSANISAAAASRCIAALVGAIKTEIQFRDDKVVIRNFGTFLPVAYASRSGRNPRTGATITIQSFRKPTFRPARNWRQEMRAGL